MAETSSSPAQPMEDIMASLRTAPWYWGPIRWREAESVLRDRPPGSFLVRDSRSSCYLFSISVRTGAGVSHTRVPQHAGLFCFGGPAALLRDADPLSLVQAALRGCESGGLAVLLNNKRGDAAEPAQLRFPLSRHSLLPSLRHLARFAVLQRLSHLQHVTQLPISPQLKEYLKDPNYIAEIS